MDPHLPQSAIGSASERGVCLARAGAFTLIEILCVITIIAILASLLMPAVSSMSLRAGSIVCANNLRSIGVACQSYLQDHNNIYPCIQPLPLGTGSNVYPANFQPTPYSSMAGPNGAFGNYGITVQITQCPVDMKSTIPASSFSQYGSSYDWKPVLDDENMNDPLIYTRRFFNSNGTIIAKLSKVRQAFDDNAGPSGTGIHFGHRNALYADGHVVSYTGAVTVGH